MKVYGVGTHKMTLPDALLMSTNNVCFHVEMRKIFTWAQLFKTNDVIS